MDTKTLPSGRTLAIGIAPFSAANKLRKVVAAELLLVEVDVGKIDAKKLTLDADLLSLDGKLLNTLKNVVCKLMASDAVENAFFECAQRSTIDGAKITRGTGSEQGTFDAPEARGDYLPSAWEVIRANLAPFFVGLDLSFLTAGAGAKPDGPKSGSTLSSTG